MGFYTEAAIHVYAVVVQNYNAIRVPIYFVSEKNITRLFNTKMLDFVLSEYLRIY